jgi:saccharopine dehydrogenase-like NADP-dependent oxidoreductase
MSWRLPPLPKYTQDRCRLTIIIEIEVKIMKILLLGLGFQGKAALHALVNSPDVERIIVADMNATELKDYINRLDTDKVTPVMLDARDEDRVAALMESVQAVILLLTPAFSLSIAKLAVAQGVHFVETSYALPEYTALGDEAAAKNLALLPEFGLDPGIDLVIAGQAVREFDEVHELHAYGSGVPEPAAADNPLNYKISWTFAGVLRSYNRPARFLQGGEIVDLSPAEIFEPQHVHNVDIDGVGRMESYPNGDAVRFLKTLGIEDTVREAGRYSMRWPGHSAFWKKMGKLGFLDETPIQVGDSSVSPRQFIHDLLAPQLQYKDNERDMTIIRVDAKGMKGGRQKRVLYHVIDRRDLGTGLLAMQRTVGFTASIGAQMILRGDIQGRGLLSPITDVPAEMFLNELSQWGIVVQRDEMEWAE